MAKLKVQELESRIAPGVNLWALIQEAIAALAETDDELAEAIDNVVDDDGNVDVAGAADIAHDAGFTNFQPYGGGTFSSGDAMVPNSVADAVRSLFGG